MGDAPSPAPAARPLGWITALTIIAVFVGLAAFQYASLPSRARANLEVALESKGDAIARVVAHTIGPAVDFDDKPFVDEVFRGVMQDPEVDFVALTVGDRVYTHQARPGVDYELGMALDPGHLSKTLLPVSVPVVVGAETKGSLRIGLSTQRIDAESSRAKQVAGAISLVLALIGVATAALATLFLRRAQQLTEVEVARTRAESVAAAKDEFLATMSHEIRTPLNAVMGMTQNLLDSRLDARQLRFCRNILDAGESLLALLNRHLDLAKLEARSFALDSQPLDVRGTAETVAMRFAHVADRKGVDLVTDVASDVPSIVHGDALRVEQMLGNLVSNALKFTKQGEIVVAVRVAARGARAWTLRFEVRDTGIGIDSAGLSRLFQPFSQASDATAREYGGTGLGLSLVKRLAEVMGGRAGVESTVGSGSTFWFEIEAALDRAGRPVETLAGRAIYLSRSAARRTGMASRFAAWGADGSTIDPTAEPLPSPAPADPPALVVVDVECLGGEAGLDAGRIVELAGGAPVVVLAPVSHPPDDLPIPRSTMLERPVKSALLRTARRAGAGHGAPAPPLPSGRGTVLVVEDNPLNQEVASVMVRSLGYDTRVVDDGPSAIQLIEQGESFHAILMDGQMPGMSGFDASRVIREKERVHGRPRTPIIACTAAERDRVSASAREAGMDHVLSKPLVKSELLAVLGSVGAADGLGPATPDPGAATSSGDGSGLDPKVIADLRLLETQAGAPLLPSLIEMYRGKMGLGLDRLESLLGAQSREDASRLAHHLKGSSLQLGLRGVAARLADVERACTSDDFERARRGLEEARRAHAQGLAELGTFVPGPPS